MPDFCTCQSGNPYKCGYCNRQAAEIVASYVNGQQRAEQRGYERGYQEGRESWLRPIRRFMRRSRIRRWRLRYRAWLIRRRMNHELEQHGLDPTAPFMAQIIKSTSAEFARLYDLLGSVNVSDYFREEYQRMAAENGTREQWEDAIGAELEVDEEPETETP